MAIDERGHDIVERGATGAIKSCEERYDLVHGDIDAHCCPDVFSVGFTPPGAVPPIVADISGPIGTAFGSMALVGPQLDVLLTNTGPTPVVPHIEADIAANAFGLIEPGARYHGSVFGAVWAKNGPPGVLGPGMGTNGPLWTVDRTGDPPGPRQRAHTAGVHLRRSPMSVVPPAFVATLDPGEFVWASFQALALATGFTGPSIVVMLGMLARLRGLRP